MCTVRDIILKPYNDNNKKPRLYVYKYVISNLQ